jgi:integrase
VPFLYKPTIITYRLKDGSYLTPDGEPVTKGTPGALRRAYKSKTWHGRYTDGAGVRHQVKLAQSKEIAGKMLAKIAGDSQLAGVGIEDPFGEHRGRPLTEHLEDFSSYLTAKNDTEDHVARTSSRIEAVLNGCGFTHLDDLQAAKIMEFIGGLRNTQDAAPLAISKAEYTRTELCALLGIHPGSVSRLLRRAGLRATGNGKARRYPRATVQALVEDLGRGTSIATCNHYLTAMKGFTRWLARERRLPTDPLSHLSRLNQEADIRRPRRALREEVFARFIEAAGAGRTFRGLTGADRLVLYTLAANTGFRASELASLTPGSFDLEAKPPTVTVGAGYSKHRRQDVQNLRPDLAELLRRYMAGKPRHSPVWPGTWVDVAAEMLRGDLAAAGIPYQDDAGRFFDFHAMRGQFISLLAAAGVHPKVAQVLARHSTITLTMDYYTHLDVLDVDGALDKLPKLPVGHKTGAPRRQG